MKHSTALPANILPFKRMISPVRSKEVIYHRLPPPETGGGVGILSSRLPVLFQEGAGGGNNFLAELRKRMLAHRSEGSVRVHKTTLGRYTASNRRRLLFANQINWRVPE